MRESYIERKVCKYAQDKGVFVVKFMSPVFAGLPDRMFIYKGYHWFIEFKAPGKLPTKLQQHVHSLMRENEAVVYVIDNIEDGIKLIEGVIKNGI